MSAHDPEAILTFWFGTLDDQGLADAAHTARWWKKDPAFDEEIQTRFGAVHEAAAAGELEAWRGEARSWLAFLIVLDQFSRNMFRGDPRGWAYDAKSGAAAKEGIARGFDRALPLSMCIFSYLPLMHAEDRATQAACVRAFETLLAECEGAVRERVANNLDFARRHQAIVDRFGRFPHRNAVLGRETTPEEAEFLTQPGSGF